MNEANEILEYYFAQQWCTINEVNDLTAVQLQALSTPFVSNLLQSGINVIEENHHVNVNTISHGYEWSLQDGFYPVTLINGAAPQSSHLSGRELMTYLISQLKREPFSRVFREPLFCQNLAGMQRAIDEEFITMDEALLIPLNKFRFFGNAIIRGIVTQGTDPSWFLSSPDILLPLLICSTLQCMRQRMINSAFLGIVLSTLTQNLSLTSYVGIIIFCMSAQFLTKEVLPILLGQITKQQILNCHSNYLLGLSDSLDDLDALVCAKPEIFDTLLKHPDKWYYLAKFSDLVINGTLSFEQLLNTTPEQRQSLNIWRFIAMSSEIDSHRDNIGARGFFYDYSDNKYNRQQAANKIHQAIMNRTYTLEEILSTQYPPRYNDNRINSLILHGILTVAYTIELTNEQHNKLAIFGVHDLLVAGTLTVAQILELQLEQCYQLDNPLIRERVINGELAIQNIPVPEPERINPRNYNINNRPQNINNAQSTHTQSIHATVSIAAQRLSERYLSELEKLTSKKVWKQIIAWSQTLPDSLENNAAKQFLSDITSNSHIDPVSGVNLFNLLQLVWLAAHDDNLRVGCLEDTLNALSTALYDTARGYNQDDNFVDDLRTTNDKACDGGQFNKIIEPLWARHPDVELEYITLTTATLKLKMVICEEVFHYLSKLVEQSSSWPAFNRVVQAVQEDGAGAIWENIKDAVSERIFDEFHSLFSDNKSISFINFIDQGQWLQLTDFTMLQKPVSQSSCYQTWMKHTLWSKNRFNPELQQAFDENYGLICVNSH